jgi:hypothetical protein
MSRLVIELNDQQQQLLALLAASSGATIEQFAKEKLFAGNEEFAWNTLKALLVERITEGLAGETSSLSISEIAKQELNTDTRAQ